MPSGVYYNSNRHDSSVPPPPATLRMLARKLFLSALVCVCAAPMLVFALLGLHSRPVTDDVCLIGIYGELDLWQNIMDRRNSHNNGSYSNLALYSALSPLGFDIVPVAPAVLIAALWLCAAALLSKALAMLGVESERRTIALALSALLTGAFCASVASRQALFWYTASVKYTAPLALTMLYLLILHHVVDQDRGPARNRAWAIAGGALCFFIAGFAEAFTAPMLLGLTLMLGCVWLARGHWRARCLSALAAGWLGAAAGVIIMLTAPAVSARATEYAERPGLSELALKSLDAWLSHISSPDALAAFALMLAAGALVGARLPLPAADSGESSLRQSRLAWTAAFVIQALLAPMLWQHQSDHALILGRFSASYFLVVVINAGILLALAFQLAGGRRGERAWKRLAHPGVWLAALLLLALLTQLRSIHWRAYVYLWLSFHSLLPVLIWQQTARLTPSQARRVGAGLAILYATTLLGMAAAVVSVFLHSIGDYPRVYTFLAFFNAWIGLCCGLIVGLSLQGGGRPIRALQGVALVFALWLGGGIAADNLALLPDFQRFSQAFDERTEMILAGRAAGQRQFTFAPLPYDLPRELGLMRLHHRHPCVLTYYDIDAPVIEG